MRLIRKIKKQEMMRRWAISEVYVEHMATMSEAIPQRLLQLLYSNEMSFVKEGIYSVLKPQHLSLLNCLPTKVTWYLAGLELTIQEFNKLQTLRVPEFEEISNNTCQLSDAAKQLYQYPYSNTRIAEIKQAAKNGSKALQWTGITLLSCGRAGPFVIIEGNGRLISLYQLLFLEKHSNLKNCELEVVLGISEERFEFGYEYVKGML
ncbi:hypothetical protein [Pedobacter polysacchareus]|uniref:hypothetical protein n=1 Tax=Pedobacter polysacchareus TaxID=2861973 RepID=UPI001C99F800|nr:hypothetical protein [Pedobacter polysacchareus]